MSPFYRAYETNNVSYCQCLLKFLMTKSLIPLLFCFAFVFIVLLLFVLLPLFNGFFPYSSIHNRIMVRVVVSNFQQYFRYIVAISFIGGGNRNTRRKPPTCTKSLTNLMT